MTFETIALEVDGGVARLTLDRPAAANALNLQMAKELLAAALHCDETPAIRAVLLTGSGKFFCAGGDLAAFADAGNAMPLLLKELTVHLHAAISRFARMRAPVVAAINGPAAGAGFSLACAADLAIAAESARFTMAYTRAGLTPDGSATYSLPRLLGRRRTMELMLTNRTLTASEALAWGLVNHVTPDAELGREADALARRLAEGPTIAFGGVKLLLLADHDLETQMELEARAIADAARTADAREGVHAFREKRPPRFGGV